jgi:hypothetical protein
MVVTTVGEALAPATPPLPSPLCAGVKLRRRRHKRERGAAGGVLESRRRWWQRRVRRW